MDPMIAPPRASLPFRLPQPHTGPVAVLLDEDHARGFRNAAARPGGCLIIKAGGACGISAPLREVWAVERPPGFV
jgi:hypothetical protein